MPQEQILAEVFPFFSPGVQPWDLIVKINNNNCHPIKPHFNMHNCYYGLEDKEPALNYSQYQ